MKKKKVKKISLEQAKYNLIQFYEDVIDYYYSGELEDDLIPVVEAIPVILCELKRYSEDDLK